MVRRHAVLLLWLVLGVSLTSCIPRINPHPGGGSGESDETVSTYLDSISEFLSSLISMLWDTVDSGGGDGGVNVTDGAWWGADWEGDGWNGTRWNGTEWNETVVYSGGT